MLMLQVIPEMSLPEPEAREIVGPYIFREDRGPTTKVILQNGLTVIVREQHAVPLSAVVTYVKAGYFDESDSVSGISHVIEHMFFKGTSRRAPGEIARETRTLGGYLNAFTAYDRTAYHTVVPAGNTLQALDIQADALWNPTFDGQELQREIGVVLEENNRKLDGPRAVTVEQLYSVAFERHRMRRWRIGRPEVLRALAREELLAYHGQFYRPSNIIVSIVGKFSREAVLDEVVRLYGEVEDQPVARELSPEEPAQEDFRYGWQLGPVEHAHIAVGYHVPGLLSEDARTLEVLSAILSEGRAARLNRFLRDEKGLVSRASAAFLGFRDFGFFQIDLETQSPVESQVALLAELENIKQFGVTDEELARAKLLLARRHYHRLETVDGVGEAIAREELLGDWKRMEGFLDEIQAVEASEIVRVAKQFLHVDNLSVFEYLPRSGGPNLDPCGIPPSGAREGRGRCRRAVGRGAAGCGRDPDRVHDRPAGSGSNP